MRDMCVWMGVYVGGGRLLETIWEVVPLIRYKYYIIISY